jgi:hypothetical protein
MKIQHALLGIAATWVSAHATADSLLIDHIKVSGSGLPAVSFYPWDATGYPGRDPATTPKAILTADTMSLPSIVVGSTVADYRFNNTLSFAPNTFAQAGGLGIPSNLSVASLLSIAPSFRTDAPAQR